MSSTYFAPYFLEVQKYEPRRGFVHVGYMNKNFSTINEVRLYYNRHNKHMRDLNKYNNLASDWDPDTYLRYVIRKSTGECLDILPWDEDEQIVM